MIPIHIALVMISDTIAVVKYAVTDQEQEGRELGIKTASEIYAPILSNLEKQQAKVLDDINKEQISFEEKVKFLRDKCATYEKEISEVSDAIESMRGLSVQIDNLIISMSVHGIQSTICNPIFYSILAKGGIIGTWLQEKMDKKRQKYYQIELEKQSCEWQKKINDVKNKIAMSIDDLKDMQNYNQEQLQCISDILNENISNYCEITAQYNLLKLVV